VGREVGGKGEERLMLGLVERAIEEVVKGERKKEKGKG